MYYQIHSQISIGAEHWKSIFLSSFKTRSTVTDCLLWNLCQQLKNYGKVLEQIASGFTKNAKNVKFLMILEYSITLFFKTITFYLEIEILRTYFKNCWTNLISVVIDYYDFLSILTKLSQQANQFDWFDLINFRPTGNFWISCI